jgi:hypothetical protein
VRRRFQRIVVSAVSRTLLLVGVLVVCGSVASGSEIIGKNIICREELSKPRRDELAAKLRAITGWSGLKFREDGTLQLSDENPAGGSPMARKLIQKALTSKTVLILEDASNRTDVVFSRVVPGIWTRDSGSRPPVYVVLIDFADFDHLMGDSRALSAFDVGWGLLHEIDHVVNDSLDAIESGETGECEDHINQMRRECNLPQRTDYYYTFFPHADESPFVTRLVRLAFEQEDPSTNKRRRYWLIWDATRVGGLNQSKQIAELR